MATTLQAHGGGAQPASIDTSGKVAGGAAQRVYGFDSVEAAQAAGYVCEGGPAMSVALITDAQIASGAWKAEGDPAALVVYTAPDGMPVEGGYAVPVYPVNGWGSAPAPVPGGPLFDSAEIGAVNASTLVVTFDSNVDASNYATGVTIKVNGTATSITNAIRQSDNHAKVNYLIPILWHGSGDTVTWEYASGSGNIVAESDSTPLGGVSAQSVTNNCEYAALLDLQADTLSIGAVSTWSDQTPSGTHHFTQSGDARPTCVAAYNGHKAIFFNAPNNEPQWMLGSSFADNLNSWSMLSLVGVDPNSNNDIVIAKIKTLANGFFDKGWVMFDIQPRLIQRGSDPDQIISGATGPQPGYDGVEHLFTAEIISKTEVHNYYNGSNAGELIGNSGVVTDYSNDLPVTIGVDYPTEDYAVSYIYGYISAIMLLTPAPSAANRAALEARLAARYGVTL